MTDTDTRTAPAAPPAAGPPRGGYLRELEIARIAVQEGHNPRAEIDAEELAALADSIARHGVLQPVVVRPADDQDQFLLVAGHRRLAAAAAAGLASVPALVRDTEPAADGALALTENVQRAALAPLEEATALARLRTERGYRTHRALAQALGKPAAWVSERLRILELPERARALVGSGAVPLATLAPLRQIARVAPAVADACAQLIERGECEAADLVRDPGGVVERVAEDALEEGDHGPVAVPIHQRARLSDLPIPAELRERLGARLSAARAERSWEGDRIHFSDADIDAARASGCLLTLARGHDALYGRGEVGFIVSADWLAENLEVIVAREEERARERAALRSETSPTPRPHAVDGREWAEMTEAERAEATARAAQEASAERRSARERAAAEAASAYLANTDFGIAIAKAYEAPEVSTPIARVLAALALRALDDKAGPDGLRLCAPGWPRVEVKTLASGQTREKVIYPTRAEATERARTLLEGNLGDRQIVGRALQAILAFAFADQAALPKSDRGWSVGLGVLPENIREDLCDLARPHLPERLRAAAEHNLARYRWDDSDEEAETRGAEALEDGEPDPQDAQAAGDAGPDAAPAQADDDRPAEPEQIALVRSHVEELVALVGETTAQSLVTSVAIAEDGAPERPPLDRLNERQARELLAELPDIVAGARERLAFEARRAA